MRHFFNPFLKMAGWHALIYGIIAMAATIFLAAHYNVHLDGILEMHINGKVPLHLALFQTGINWLTLVLVFGIASLILNPSGFRLLDLLGIMAFVRVPFIVLPPLHAVIDISVIADKIRESVLNGSQNLMLNATEYAIFGVYLLITTLFIILSVTWMYNGFRLLSHSKGIRANIIFIISLLIGLIISELAINQLPF